MAWGGGTGTVTGTAQNITALLSLPARIVCKEIHLTVPTGGTLAFYGGPTVTAVGANARGEVPIAAERQVITGAGGGAVINTDDVYVVGAGGSIFIGLVS